MTWVETKLSHCDRPDDVADALLIVRGMEVALRQLLVYFRPQNETEERAVAFARASIRKYMEGP